MIKYVCSLCNHRQGGRCAKYENLSDCSVSICHNIYKDEERGLILWGDTWSEIHAHLICRIVEFESDELPEGSVIVDELPRTGKADNWFKNLHSKIRLPWG